uniref:Putative translin associated factor x n=1 Tax=Anopheles triannulatus TaxID=58253 RepID=A0A2M4ARS9_9DIPT
MSQNRGNRRNHHGRSGGRGGGGGSGTGGGGRRGGRDGQNAGSAVSLDETNPIIQSFRGYARELDAKHDRHERIVKCSRDITIESKRIIFLLHTIDPRKNNDAKVCEEAKQRLENLFRNQFFVIAKELRGQDAYQYARAYTHGMQEFIEAYSFYEYSSGQDISHWHAVQEKLRYKHDATPPVKQESTNEPNDSNTAPVIESSDGQPETESPSATTTDNNQGTLESVCLLQPLDFVLGLGDLSGEIMRKCINGLGSGQVDSCFGHCRFMQDLYRGFLSVSSARSRDFSHKMSTLRQSLVKSENVCYNVTMRGGEAAKWGGGPSDEAFASFVGNANFEAAEEDEGVYF